MHLIPVLSLLLSFIPLSVAVDSPLWVQGSFENATTTDATYNTGGTVTVNGFAMNVPKNLLVQFPAAWVPFKDFVESKHDFLGFETQVIGNRLDGVPHVAQIIIYEFFEGESTGWIQSVNYTDGSMKIQDGPTVRINDPNGVFSVGHDGAPFLTADDVSPSITSFSGFPMCIPRNSSDPLCPLSSRPTPGPGIFVAPDQLVMAPFQPGDFVTFSGFRRGDEVIAFTIVAENVQIRTTGDLVYVRMVLGLLGIFNNNPITELAQSRFIGFVSNPLATLTPYSMDVDPCTGDVTKRLIAGSGLKGGVNAQNKWEYRADILFGYTREYYVETEINGIPKKFPTKNGLMVGTYVQPVNVWIPGEQDTPGVPPPNYDFSQMAFLTEGVGLDDQGRLWGPLDPFPQSNIPINVPFCLSTPGPGPGLPPIIKRASGGRWMGETRGDAKADAESRGSEDNDDVVLAPDQKAAIEAYEKAQDEKAITFGKASSAGLRRGW
ncbi:hypothetical protein QBC44DRAFT_314448 [Cladorrhinum sp. PSN332]|nr:hypothetical protein QBC44DRAFT_314448 [Cladorrhinum sp. PSN332]